MENPVSALGGTTPFNMKDFSRMMGWGALGSGLGSLFGGMGNDPYKDASKYYNQIPGTITPHFQPYIDAGKNALGQLQGQYGNLINDPGSIYNKLGSGYQQSPGFQFQLGQGLGAINNAAAAGGLQGAPQHQQQAGQLANNLANQDFNNYLGNMMGLYGKGLSGMGDINQMGYGASTGLAQLLASNLMNQGNMALSGGAARNQSQGAGWGNIFSALGLFGL